MKCAKVRVLNLVVLVAGLLALLPAQAQISFRGAGAQSVTTGSSLVPAIASGTQAGDLAVLVVVGRPSDTSTPAAPSGWTLRSSALREVGSRDLKIVTYYRVLAGGDTNPTLSVPANWQGGQAGISGQIAVWSGVNTASPFDVADATGNAAAASPWTPPAVSTVSAGARAVSAVASADDNALNFSSQQGFTLRMSGATYDTTSGGDHSVGVADKDQPTAGAVTMISWGQTANASDAWVGITFALKPKTEQLYFIHADHLDTPRLITNAAQPTPQVVWRWDNDDPFGNNAPNENPSGLGNFTCNLRFPGQYYDKETNLSYNYFRDYDPAIGRYSQSDPIGLAGGINTYAYVNGNPLSLADPDGLWSISVTVIGPKAFGGSLVVGQNPNGTMFSTGAVLVGIPSFSIKWNALGRSPGYSPEQCTGQWGWSAGATGQVDFQTGLGGFGYLGVSGNAGYVSGARPDLFASATPRLGAGVGLTAAQLGLIGISANAGVQFTISK